MIPCNHLRLLKNPKPRYENLPYAIYSDDAGETWAIGDLAQPGEKHKGLSANESQGVFFSSMLTGDHPDRKWGDVYVAVVRYPEPPLNLRSEGTALVWDMPRRHTEIRGFRLYRSDESGRNSTAHGQDEFPRLGEGARKGDRRAY